MFRNDHTIAFGFASGPGNAGAIQDCVIDILAAFLILAKKWVDDYMFANKPIFGLLIALDSELTVNTITFFFLSSIVITPFSSLSESCAAIPRRLLPDQLAPSGCETISFTYAYNQTDIETVTEVLGVPWAAQKWQDFAFEVECLGFRWDTWHKRVYLPEGKRVKYLARVNNILVHPRVRLQLLEKVHGCLMHITFVHRMGLSRLPGLQRFMNGFKGSRFSQRELTPAARSDLTWWQQALAGPGAFRMLVNRGEPIDRGISVDASKTYGIGLRIGNSYLAWKWKSGALGQGGRDIGGAEAIALEFALRALKAMGIVQELTKVLGDNTSTIGAYERGRGRNVWTNESVRRTWELQAEMSSELAVVYVPSAENPADCVSRGDFSGLTRLSCTFTIPSELEPFLVEA